jgi:FecR-like protein
MMFRKHQPVSDEHMRDLPLAAAPDSLWASIEAALDAGEKPRRRWFAFPLWRPAVAAALLTILAVAIWSWTRPPKPQWEVVRLEGAPLVYSNLLGVVSKIGSRYIAGSGTIAEGQWLQTDASSQAVIRVGDIGTVRVDPNTRVRLMAARPAEHRLALARGRISANVSAPPRLFFVDTSSSTAVDLGCAYTMDADDAGNGWLRVTLGRVSLEWNGRESLVPAGASCRTRPKTGPGTPFFDDATEALKQALNGFDFDNGGSQALKSVLASARVRDTLTLWHLLSRVDAGERVRVYDRMIELVPLPAGVSPAKALQLDPETLKHWREELAWKW